MDIDGIKVIKYEGDFSSYGMMEIEKDNPDFKKLSIEEKKDLFNDDIYNPRSQKLLQEHWDKFKNHKKLENFTYYNLLRDIDALHWKNVGIPWEKEKIKKYNAKFAIELHSTSHGRNTDPYVIFSTLSINGKMRKLLKEYERNIYLKLPKNPIAKETSPPSPNTVIQIHIDNIGLFHMFSIEAMHNSDLLNLKDEKNDAVKYYSEIIEDVSHFFRQEYPELWKNY